jgi:hypothetical protein
MKQLDLTTVLRVKEEMQSRINELTKLDQPALLAVLRAGKSVRPIDSPGDRNECLRLALLGSLEELFHDNLLRQTALPRA